MTSKHRDQSIVAAAVAALCLATACAFDPVLDEASAEEGLEAEEGLGAEEEGLGAEEEGLGAEEDLGDELEASNGFLRIKPCPSPSSYAASGVVRFGPWRPSFTSPCTRLATGGTVVFQGFLSMHPIEPRRLGLLPSPIEPTSAGGSVEFEFTNPGFYPYRCALHPGEVGVIWVSSGF
jgi:hypothetical protein